MKMNKWKILLMVSTILWTVGLELYFAKNNGPTITWVFVHYIPQEATMMLVSALGGWLGKHLIDNYRKNKDESK